MTQYYENSPPPLRFVAEMAYIYLQRELPENEFLRYKVVGDDRYPETWAKPYWIEVELCPEGNKEGGRVLRLKFDCGIGKFTPLDPDIDWAELEKTPAFRGIREELLSQ